MEINFHTYGNKFSYVWKFTPIRVQIYADTCADLHRRVRRRTRCMQRPCDSIPALPYPQVAPTVILRAA
jgi:hypothetical protein